MDSCEACVRGAYGILSLTWETGYLSSASRQGYLQVGVGVASWLQGLGPRVAFPLKAGSEDVRLV